MACAFHFHSHLIRQMSQWTGVELTFEKNMNLWLAICCATKWSPPSISLTLHNYIIIAWARQSAKSRDRFQPLSHLHSTHGPGNRCRWVVALSPMHRHIMDISIMIDILVPSNENCNFMISCWRPQPASPINFPLPALRSLANSAYA